jgi:hypothetical protein
MNNTIKIIAASLALIIYFILSDVYSPLNFTAVFQFFVNKFLPSIIDIALLNFKFFTRLLRDVSRDLNEEIIDLFAKNEKILTIL